MGGVWLAALGGSLYFVITGVAMMIAGWLLFRQQLLGGWLYIAIFSLTVIWAFWEVGANGWALVPRVIAPLVLLIAVLLVMLSLKVAANRWRLDWGGIADVLYLG